MELDVPEEAYLLRDTIRRFVREVLHPVEVEIEETDRIPPHIVEELRKLGLFGLAIPQEYGGLGLSLLAQCVVFEELAKASLCFRSRVGTNNGPVRDLASLPREDPGFHRTRGLSLSAAA